MPRPEENFPTAHFDSLIRGDPYLPVILKIQWLAVKRFPGPEGCGQSSSTLPKDLCTPAQVRLQQGNPPQISSMQSDFR
jgi:hypothetical protein